MAPNPEEAREASPKSTVSLTSQRHPETLPEVTGTSQGNPGFPAANLYLRNNLQQLCSRQNLEFAAPPIKLCTDNGVMIAWAGIEHAQNNMFDSLDFKPRPRWPLDETAPKAQGAGGVKA